MQRSGSSNGHLAMAKQERGALDRGPIGPTGGKKILLDPNSYSIPWGYKRDPKPAICDVERLGKIPSEVILHFNDLHMHSA